MNEKKVSNNGIYDEYYDDIILNNEISEYLYISERLEINKYEFYLINNTYKKEIRLLIIDSETNTLANKYNIPSRTTELDDLNESTINLIKSILQSYGNETDLNYYYEYLTETIEQYNYFTVLKNETIKDYIENLKKEIIKDKKEKEKNYLNTLINNIKNDILIIINKEKGKNEQGEPLNPKNLNRSDLSEYIAKYLSLKYGLILRSNVNTPHLLNADNNCYELTDHETILKLIANDFGHNTVSMKEIIKSLDYIDNRIKPSYNIIRFNNMTYDMDTHKTINLNSPLLPYYDIYFNYNPEAKGELIQQFLYSSLNEKQVKGLLELIGYLFTVENKENIITCFIGKGGSGKSVLSNILTHLFKRVSNLPIHNLNKDHEISILENKLLNICNDTDNKEIKDNGTFKQITGGDSLHINPKYRMPYIMPPQEVPYFIIVGNQFPKFKNLEIPIIERLMLIEFKKGFRNTKEQNKNLYDDIISNNDNIEWLIYNSLKAYSNMVINNKEFTLRKTTKENLDLYNKHTDPLKWIVKKLIVFDDDLLITSDISEKDLNNYNFYIGVDELKQRILNYANNEGLDITNENNNLSTNQLTKAIVRAFNLWNLKDNYNIEYKPIRKRENGNRIYVYPNIRFKEE